MKSLLTKNKNKPINKASKPDLHPAYGGLVKGSTDATHPDCVLVPLDKAPRHPSFRPVAPKFCPPQTFYRYDKAEKRIRCLVSVMADGLVVAWDTCGGCAWYWSLCRCANGIRAPRSVEYIYDHVNAVKAGEDWDHNHPLYRGSFSKADRDAMRRRQEARYSERVPYRPPVTTPAPDRPSDGRTVTPTATSGHKRLVKAGATARTTRNDADEVFDARGNLDMRKLDDAASKMAKSFKQLSKNIDKNAAPATGKRLMKRGGK